MAVEFNTSIGTLPVVLPLPVERCMMYYIMHRTQILLDGWQYERLKAVAEREGTSISSLVRDAVTRFLESLGSEETTRLSDIAGIAADPDSTGRDHDEALYGPRRTRR